MLQKTFYQIFRENMNAIGLPAPESLFGTLGTATGTLKTMAGFVSKYGSKATFADLGGVSGWADLAAAGLVAWYFGAAVGSAAVATGQVTSGGYTIADSLSTLHNMRIEPASWMHEQFHNLCQRSHGRSSSPPHIHPGVSKGA
jgi:hypothetical protein